MPHRVDENLRKKIDDIQPYNKVGGPEHDPLTVLNMFSNRDKHRTFSPAYGAIRTGQYVVSPTGPVSWRNVEIRTDGKGEIKIKTEMMLERTPSRDTDIITVENQVEMPGEVGAEFVFQCGNKLVRLSEIKAAIRHAAGIIRWFERDFDDA